MLAAAQVARSSTGAGAEAAAPEQRLDEFKARLGNLSPMEVRTEYASHVHSFLRICLHTGLRLLRDQKMAERLECC